MEVERGGRVGVGVEIGLWNIEVVIIFWELFPAIAVFLEILNLFF